MTNCPVQDTSKHTLMSPSGAQPSPIYQSVISCMASSPLMTLDKIGLFSMGPKQTVMNSGEVALEIS